MAGKLSKAIKKVEAKQLDLFAPVEVHAERIEKVKVGIAKNIFVIGAELTKAHDKLAHHGNGVWVRWCEERCGFTRMSANRYMQVHEVFGKTEDRNNLLPTFDDSAMYVLAAPNTPREALDAAIERADAGEKITHKLAKEIVAEFKNTPKTSEEEFIIQQEVDRWTGALETKLSLRVPAHCKFRFVDLLITYLKSIQDDAAHNDNA